MFLAPQEWIDERLAWAKEEYSDLDQVVINAENIWKPEFAIINGYVLNLTETQKKFKKLMYKRIARLQT